MKVFHQVNLREMLTSLTMNNLIYCPMLKYEYYIFYIIFWTSVVDNVEAQQ